MRIEDGYIVLDEMVIICGRLKKVHHFQSNKKKKMEIVTISFSVILLWKVNAVIKLL